MSRDARFYFYALMVNGHTASLHITYEEAIDKLKIHIAEDDSDRYGIERVDGVWELIKRMGAFEDYSDEWMEEVIYVTHAMVEDRKGKLSKVANKQQGKKQEEQDKK